MSAEIISLDERREPPNPGNGAREALIEVALSLPNGTTLDDAEKWADWILMEAWSRGFVMVPLE